MNGWMDLNLHSCTRTNFEAGFFLNRATRIHTTNTDISYPAMPCSLTFVTQGGRHIPTPKLIILIS